jgi:hypothetical protein
MELNHYKMEVISSLYVHHKFNKGETSDFDVKNISTWKIHCIKLLVLRRQERLSWWINTHWYVFECVITFCYLKTKCGPGSSVGIATDYRLDGLGIRSWWQARFSAPVQTSPGAHPASCTMGTRSLPGVESSRGMTLTSHPLLVSWSQKGRAIPLLPLRAVWPVQSLSACTRVHFTFYLF